MNLRDLFILTTWWGKILGAFFGYLSAGPVGAMFGLLVGNFFDRGLVSLYNNPHWIYLSEKRKIVQKAFFETTFLVMGYVAKSDGRVSAEEIKMAKLLMTEMRLSKEQKELAKQLFSEGKTSQFNLTSSLIKLKTLCRDNRELLKLFIDIQYRAAQIDGLNQQKINALNNILSDLGFAPLNKQYRFYEDFGRSTYQYQQQSNQQRSHNTSSNTNSNTGRNNNYNYNREPPLNALAQAYAILEVNQQATKQEVRKAYRRLLSQNHPDKLIAQGLPDEMIKLANDKTHQIVKAYQLISESKGW
ncbi:co-chaperone DjlA [Legionella waltersii]|uniref:Co-chaperone protein DjlA n=1 Tax=Legionella waltersii TaxID=66969 RepID=A0A0W1AGS6_9GAMM|nr:co-chaperone DjlA [Legionella waltersii]KTD80489.1 DNA binding protein DnaJ, heat shock protein [Legionella waltersii]SNV09708.1 DNA binding protein DnaJ, heat shock protein [Legionella waltersii]